MFEYQRHYMTTVTQLGLDWSYQSYQQHILSNLLPLRERLKQPNLSPARESAPHCSTTAEGLQTSMTFDITGLKIISQASSSIPSRSGKFTAQYFPFSAPTSYSSMVMVVIHCKTGNGRHNIVYTLARTLTPTPPPPPTHTQLALRSPVPGKYSPYL